MELLAELCKESSVEILSSFERLVHIVGWLQQNFPVVIIVIVVTVMVAGTPPASPNLPTLLSAEPNPMLAAVPCVWLSIVLLPTSCLLVACLGKL